MSKTTGKGFLRIRRFLETIVFVDRMRSGVGLLGVMASTIGVASILRWSRRVDVWRLLKKREEKRRNFESASWFPIKGTL